MTSPLSRISTGSFFTGLSFEYSSFGVPGATVTGVNSILSIRPSSIAAMRTFRANGDAGEKVSFIRVPPGFSHVVAALAASSRRDDLLALLAQTLDAKRYDVTDIEELRRLHAVCDTGRRTGGDDVARHQRQELRDIGDALGHRKDHGRGRPGLPALAVDVEPHRQFLHIGDFVPGDQPRAERT